MQPSEMNPTRIRRPRRTALHAVPAALALVLLFQVGPASDLPAQDARPSRETKQERKAAKKAEKERRKAEKQAAKLEKKRSTGRFSGRTAEALVGDARSFLEQKKWLRAREILLFLEDNERALDVQDEVKLLLADSYYGEGGTLNWVEALARYRTFMTFFPRHPEVPRAQYRIGMCYMNQAPKSNRDQSTTDNALYEFQKLIELYPNSNWADEAQARIQEARGLLADHEFEVARFYLERGHNEAAAGRFQGILSEFPDYEQKAEVYRLLAQAHYGMGSTLEGDIYADKYREMGGSGSIHEGLSKKAKKQQAKARKASGDAADRGEESKSLKKQRKAADKREKQLRKQQEKERKRAEKQARKEAKEKKGESEEDQGDTP